MSESLALTKEILYKSLLDRDGAHVTKDNEWSGHFTQAKRFSDVGEAVRWIRGAGLDLPENLAVYKHLSKCKGDIISTCPRLRIHTWGLRTR